jgi:predicted nucleic acid-binding protein
VAVLGINRAVAKRNGQIRRELRRQHRQIAHRAFDLLIAATALEHSLTLVTRNLDDYADIPGLDIYESGRHTPEKRPS